MKKMENTYFMDGQAAKFSEDFERESLKDSVYLLEEQQLLMQEIMKEEHRLPAKIQVITEIPTEHEVKHNTLPF